MRTLTFLLAILLRSLAVCENVRVVQSIDILPPRPYYFEDIIAACEERIEDQHEVRSKFDCRVKSILRRSEGAMKIQLLMRLDNEQTQMCDGNDVVIVDADKDS